MTTKPKATFKTKRSRAKGDSSELPLFGQDAHAYATLLVGRRFEKELTVAEMTAALNTAAEWARKTGLALAVVNTDVCANKDDDAEVLYNSPYAGIVLAWAEDTKAPVVVKAQLDAGLLATIPAAFWSELEEKYGLAFEEAEHDEDEDLPSGIFLVPAGWAVAWLYTGKVEQDGDYFNVEGNLVLTSSSEDSTPGKRLSDDALAAIRASSEPLILKGGYC